jgi:hypothetical protein
VRTSAFAGLSGTNSADSRVAPAASPFTGLGEGQMVPPSTADLQAVRA